jgi:hypothetical protein
MACCSSKIVIERKTFNQKKYNVSVFLAELSISDLGSGPL